MYSHSDEPRRDYSRRGNPRRDEPRQDGPRQDSSRRDGPQRDGFRRDDPRWDNPPREPHSYPRKQGYKAGKSIPDRWLDYSKIGQRIQGTGIVAFKTPLKESILNSLPEPERWSIEDLVKFLPNLGLVIDLTFTKKYYDVENFVKHGIQYKKIFCEGHIVPKPQVCQEFRDEVNNFRRTPGNERKIVGVHCTHGLNRTGYLVCRFMIDELNMPPNIAIEYFEQARGHPMERENYIKSLHSRRYY